MRILLKNATIVNDGNAFEGNILIENGRISEITKDIILVEEDIDRVIDCKGKYVLPGIIDDQVHFREPGLTHKGDIYSESKAAVAGGITSFMEMPNTNPQTINEKHITDKWNIAEKNSFCNYSFYIGATNENIKDLESANYRNICGVKVFLGSSTGNMLVNDPNILKQIFSISHIPIAIHSEDDNIVKANLEKYKVIHGDDIPVSLHHEIRDTEACYQSTKRAVELAKECNTRLHVLHISTEKELEFFEKGTDYNKKHITSEVCVHHLLFNSDDYSTYGSKIKWNPAIKCKADQESLLKAVNNDLIDIIATDHAPHTIEEKSNSYLKCPSGGPLVQHSLVAMLELYHQNKISIEKIVEKMCHAPARLFKIQDRGYIKKGYWADLTIVDLNAPWQVTKDNILYKCGWSPFEGWTFKSKVTHTFVNGNLIYENGTFNETIKGQRLEFNN